MVAWCWWVSAGCLALALVATGFGIAWSALPVKVTDNANGTFTIEAPDGWKRVRGAVMLGVGLLFTTLAGMFALLAAPPWMAA